MPINILMPALSPTMEKGNLAKWLKKEGDKVKPGDVIAEIETDKATMEYEAVDEGTIAKIVVPEGSADIPVNQLIAVLATEGEDVKSAASAADKGAPAPPAAAPKPAAPQPASTPQAAKPAPAGAPAPRPAAATPATNGHARVFASPLARRLARDAGIDIGRIAGSGPRGRVVAHDVEQAKSGGGLRAPAGGAGTALPFQPQSDDKIRALFQPGSYEVVPHDHIRKIIARRLVEAKLTIPHFYLTLTCNIDRLLAAREDINMVAPKGADGKPAWKVSVNDFCIKALALALKKIPDANVTWTEGGMLKHQHADIGVAVAIPGGLITPVVRQAETKKLTDISTEMKDLAGRARVRRLKPEEYQGGSTSISNLGMFGIQEFAAVINPPHATILAVGVGEQRPLVRDGKIEVASQMTVTLSTDHRAVDGALGAEFLGAFKSFIENPVGLVM
jgi:pyruvate dehydrogenase E2 component (dihydrolipoamide acetyltransferase)